MSGVTRIDWVPDECIRRTVKVTDLTVKIQVSRLRWVRPYSTRRAQLCGKTNDEIERKRKRGRPLTCRWSELIVKGLKDKNLQEWALD